MTIVVKLGGSLYGSAELHHWLQVLKQYAGHQSIILVPGGGPFADQVRQAQKIHPFDDKTAHSMALLAMRQFGLLLSGQAPACRTFQGKTVPADTFSIWLPDDDLLQEACLPHTWDITSDSIALWLAIQIQASQLVLVKRSNLCSQSVQQLSQNHVLDHGFSHLFRQNQIKTRIIHYQQHAHFESFISMDDHFLILP